MRRRLGRLTTSASPKSSSKRSLRKPTGGVGSRPFEGSRRGCTMRWTSASSRSEERRVGKECRSLCDWSSDVCSSDLELFEEISEEAYRRGGFPTVRGVQAWMHDEMDFGEL